MQLSFIKLKLSGGSTTDKAGLLHVGICFLFFWEALNTSVRSFQSFIAQKQSGSGGDVGVCAVSVWCCCCSLWENLSQLVGADLIKEVMGLFCVLHTLSFVWFKRSDLQAGRVTSSGALSC